MFPLSEVHFVYHYVYYSYEEWGRGYIGCRSCKCSPEEDTRYFGSYYDTSFSPTDKIILGCFPTREEALAAEIALHRFYEIDKNSHFANKARQTSTGFVSSGQGMKVCLEKYPDFRSNAGKKGGSASHKKGVGIFAPENLGKGSRSVVEKKVGIHSPDFDNAAAGKKGADCFPAGSPQAKARSRKGTKARKDFWANHPEKKRKKGTYGTHLSVELPSREVLSFPSINLAADTLGIPRTSMKRLARGELMPKYKDYRVTRK